MLRTSSTKGRSILARALGEQPQMQRPSANDRSHGDFGQRKQFANTTISYQDINERTLNRHSEILSSARWTALPHISSLSSAMTIQWESLKYCAVTTYYQVLFARWKCLMHSDGKHQRSLTFPSWSDQMDDVSQNGTETRDWLRSDNRAFLPNTCWDCWLGRAACVQLKRPFQPNSYSPTFLSLKSHQVRLSLINRYLIQQNRIRANHQSIEAATRTAFVKRTTAPLGDF